MKKGNGKLKEWLQSKGKNALGITLDSIGENTSIPFISNIIENIGEGLMSDPNLSEQEKQEAAELIQAELDLLKVEQQEVSKRWASDMLSDSWLSKNIRPLVVGNMILMFDALIICGFCGVNLLGNYIALFTTILVTTLGGYFSLRTIEKRNKKKYL